MYNYPTVGLSHFGLTDLYENIFTLVHLWDRLSYSLQYSSGQQEPETVELLMDMELKKFISDSKTNSNLSVRNYFNNTLKKIITGVHRMRPKRSAEDSNGISIGFKTFQDEKDEGNDNAMFLDGQGNAMHKDGEDTGMANGIPIDFQEIAISQKLNADWQKAELRRQMLMGRLLRPAPDGSVNIFFNEVIDMLEEVVPMGEELHWIPGGGKTTAMNEDERVVKTYPHTSVHQLKKVNQESKKIDKLVAKTSVDTSVHQPKTEKNEIKQNKQNKLMKQKKVKLEKNKHRKQKELKKHVEKQKQKLKKKVKQKELKKYLENQKQKLKEKVKQKELKKHLEKQKQKLKKKFKQKELKKHLEKQKQKLKEKVKQKELKKHLKKQKQKLKEKVRQAKKPEDLRKAKILLDKRMKINKALASALRFMTNRIVNIYTALLIGAKNRAAKQRKISSAKKSIMKSIGILESSSSTKESIQLITKLIRKITPLYTQVISILAKRVEDKFLIRGVLKKRFLPIDIRKINAALASTLRLMTLHISGIETVLLQKCKSSQRKTGMKRVIRDKKKIFKKLSSLLKSNNRRVSTALVVGVVGDITRMYRRVAILLAKRVRDLIAGMREERRRRRPKFVSKINSALASGLLLMTVRIARIETVLLWNHTKNKVPPENKDERRIRKALCTLKKLTNEKKSKALLALVITQITRMFKRVILFFARLVENKMLETGLLNSRKLPVNLWNINKAFASELHPMTHLIFRLKVALDSSSKRGTKYIGDETENKVIKTINGLVKLKDQKESKDLVVRIIDKLKPIYKYVVKLLAECVEDAMLNKGLVNAKSLPISMTSINVVLASGLRSMTHRLFLLHSALVSKSKKTKTSGDEKTIINQVDRLTHMIDPNKSSAIIVQIIRKLTALNKSIVNLMASRVEDKMMSTGLVTSRTMPMNITIINAALALGLRSLANHLAQFEAALLPPGEEAFITEEVVKDIQKETRVLEKSSDRKASTKIVVGIASVLTQMYKTVSDLLVERVNDKLRHNINKALELMRTKSLKIFQKFDPILKQNGENVKTSAWFNQLKNVEDGADEMYIPTKEELSTKMFFIKQLVGRLLQHVADRMALTYQDELDAKAEILEENLFGDLAISPEQASSFIEIINEYIIGYLRWLITNVANLQIKISNDLPEPSDSKIHANVLLLTKELANITQKSSKHLVSEKAVDIMRALSPALSQIVDKLYRKALAGWPPSTPSPDTTESSESSEEPSSPADVQLTKDDLLERINMEFIVRLERMVHRVATLCIAVKY